MSSRDITPKYRVWRPAGKLKGVDDLCWNPPVDSDELFEILRDSFPDIKTHQQRKQQAVIQFFLSENEQNSQSLLTRVNSNDLESTNANSNLKRSSGITTDRPAKSLSPQHVTSTSSFSNSSDCPSLSSRSSPASVSQLSTTSSPHESVISSKRLSPPSFDDMITVWNSGSVTKSRTTRHPRKQMTDKQREAYRMRRILGACTDCRRKKSQCFHDQASSNHSIPKQKKTKESLHSNPSGFSVMKLNGKDDLQVSSQDNRMKQIEGKISGPEMSPTAYNSSSVSVQKSSDEDKPNLPSQSALQFPVNLGAEHSDINGTNMNGNLSVISQQPSSLVSALAVSFREEQYMPAITNEIFTFPHTAQPPVSPHNNSMGPYFQSVMQNDPFGEPSGFSGNDFVYSYTPKINDSGPHSNFPSQVQKSTPYGNFDQFNHGTSPDTRNYMTQDPFYGVSFESPDKVPADFLMQVEDSSIDINLNYGLDIDLNFQTSYPHTGMWDIPDSFSNGHLDRNSFQENINWATIPHAPRRSDFEYEMPVNLDRSPLSASYPASLNPSNTVMCGSPDEDSGGHTSTGFGQCARLNPQVSAHEPRDIFDSCTDYGPDSPAVVKGCAFCVDTRTTKEQFKIWAKDNLTCWDNFRHGGTQNPLLHFQHADIQWLPWFDDAPYLCPPQPYLSPNNAVFFSADQSPSTSPLGFITFILSLYLYWLFPSRVWSCCQCFRGPYRILSSTVRRLCPPYFLGIEFCNTLESIFLISKITIISLIIFIGLITTDGPSDQTRRDTTSQTRIAPMTLDPNKLALPHVTIQFPVYREGLNSVIEPTVRSIRAALSAYEMQGGTALIFISDDGIQLRSEGEPCYWKENLMFFSPFAESDLIKFLRHRFKILDEPFTTQKIASQKLVSQTESPSPTVPSLSVTLCCLGFVVGTTFILMRALLVPLDLLFVVCNVCQLHIYGPWVSKVLWLCFKAWENLRSLPALYNSAFLESAHLLVGISAFVVFSAAFSRKMILINGRTRKCGSELLLLVLHFSTQTAKTFFTQVPSFPGTRIFDWIHKGFTLFFCLIPHLKSRLDFHPKAIPFRSKFLSALRVNFHSIHDFLHCLSSQLRCSFNVLFPKALRVSASSPFMFP